MPERRLREAERLRHTEHVMGTVFSFDLRHEPTRATRAALGEAVAWLHHVDRVFSTYRPDSAISRIGDGSMNVTDAPPEVERVLRMCERAESATRGCFSARAGRRLDPSGLVKGWAVEQAYGLLRTAGAPNSLVNGGGDIRLGGEPAPGSPWRVGVTDPCGPGRLLTTVEGRDFAVATSGGAERGPHILDPRTGRPAHRLLAATVTGPDLTWADSWATAAVVQGTDAHTWIATQPGYELLTVDLDGQARRSGGFPLAAATRAAPRAPGAALDG
ncbi:FAD:protein FMN transferase [Streptomyces lavendulae]|uniref:FAD:protein FMN transferase n=1 Tax=Streptomyces lavendulae subsp. lavendulae TaxID=58340 RepID=A0A2K8PPJ2_STRLA|nr:Thiamine biosynthesis lipoprotein ApbE precursor [Streptomyces lavendulae subsp. lavendulae]QUQ58469.1 FAD:protein FMN transferase [Streptomyces lavendulae subsp. lavendulae]